MYQNMTNAHAQNAKMTIDIAFKNYTTHCKQVRTQLDRKPNNVIHFQDNPRIFTNNSGARIIQKIIGCKKCVFYEKVAEILKSVFFKLFSYSYVRNV